MLTRVMRFEHIRARNDGTQPRGKTDNLCAGAPQRWEMSALPMKTIVQSDTIHKYRVRDKILGVLCHSGVPGRCRAKQILPSYSVVT